MKTGGSREALCGFNKQEENRFAVDEPYLLKAFPRSATVEGQYEVLSALFVFKLISIELCP